MRFSRTLLALLVICVSSCLANPVIPVAPVVSEVDIPVNAGPVIIVLEQNGYPEEVVQDPSSEVSNEAPEDFVPNPVVPIADVPDSSQEKKPAAPKPPVGKPQKPPGKPQKPPAGKPQKPPGKPQKPPGGKPQKPGGKPQKPPAKPQKPSGRPQRPSPKPQRPQGKPNRPGKPSLLEGGISEESLDFTTTFFPDVEYDFELTTSPTVEI